MTMQMVLAVVGQLALMAGSYYVGKLRGGLEMAAVALAEAEKFKKLLEEEDR